jgi:hypothetical protein
MQGFHLYQALSLAHGEPPESIERQWMREDQFVKVRCDRVMSVLEKCALPYTGDLIHTVYRQIDNPDAPPFEALADGARFIYTKAAELLTCECALARFCDVCSYLVTLASEECPEAADSFEQHCLPAGEVISVYMAGYIIEIAEVFADEWLSIGVHLNDAGYNPVSCRCSLCQGRDHQPEANGSQDLSERSECSDLPMNLREE